MNGGSRGWSSPRETPGQSSKPGTLMKPIHGAPRPLCRRVTRRPASLTFTGTAPADLRAAAKVDASDNGAFSEFKERDGDVHKTAKVSPRGAPMPRRA